ncbi:DUF6346 domain-containing protein [Micromonospora sp. HM5-17]|uniref:DUF6346 domain-containing protein n=1 Tax=Micromonospora sp. HM5-17 TaxID=2487710 RepID=UPI000F484F48|nr:DUF6346 domain-containing protein [Micromonospora sp. HM5-17]ROT26786.1 hypothetical protein EF879_24455 [Micromonospora sp. HM5-17]
MEPRDDRIAKRLAEIRAEEREWDRAARARDADGADPEAAARDADVAAVRRRGGALRSFLFLAGTLVLAASLFGVAVTLSRLAGSDMADATREGQATVTSCHGHGPISSRGFGSWESCEVEIVWSGGEVEHATVGAVFTSVDLGRSIRVGDLGRHRGARKLARADVEARPWLRWLGYGVGALALPPALVGVLLLRETVRLRRR